MAIKVVLAEDHSVVREGLRSMLEKSVDIRVIGEAADGVTAVKLAAKLQPDIMVMDIGMPKLNGIDATESIVSDHPHIGVIILSMHKEERFVSGAFLAGAKGYLLKESLFDELMQAIQVVYSKRVYLSPEIAHVAVNAFKQRSCEIAQRPASVLSSREREILQMLVEGNKVSEIGDQLFISPKTVESHRRNIYEKINVSKSVDLIRYALREGVVSIDTWLSQED
jgi:DNA-binding NarL/FixJ family response regulator